MMEPCKYHYCPNCGNSFQNPDPRIAELEKALGEAVKVAHELDHDGKDFDDSQDHCDSDDCPRCKIQTLYSEAMPGSDK